MILTKDKENAMQKLTLFYLPRCPHCKLALRYYEQLCQENPAFAKVELELVDESRERARANRYDYWYVPSFYLGQTKLHEGHAERADVKAVLQAAIGQAGSTNPA